MRILTVAELLAACADLQPTDRVALELADRIAPAVGAYPQASDAVPGPAGTDPQSESTVGVLVIIVGGADA